MEGLCEMQTEWQISYPVVRYFKMLPLHFFARKIKLFGDPFYEILFMKTLHLFQVSGPLFSFIES